MKLTIMLTPEMAQRFRQEAANSTLTRTELHRKLLEEALYFRGLQHLSLEMLIDH